MKILNLFAGIGGNRSLWKNSHQITAIEYDDEIGQLYATRFPNDLVIIDDAYKYLKEHYKEFDFIWGSPPCQTHTRMRTLNPIKEYSDLRLYEVIIFLQSWFKGDWVIENVIPYYKPLIRPKAQIERHFYWSNKLIDRKIKFKRINIIGALEGERDDEPTLEDLCDAYKISIDLLNENKKLTKRKKLQILRNCVRPEVGLYIFNQINHKKKNQTKLETFQQKTR